MNQSAPWVRAVLWLGAVALVVWVLSRVSLADAWAAVRQLDARAVSTLIGVNLVALVVFGARWWILLYALGHPIGLASASLYRLAAFGFSYFTPGPQIGGEPVQVLLAERRHGVPRDVAIASVGLDRLFDGVVNLAFLAASAFVFAGLGAAMTVGLLVMTIVPVAYVVALGTGRRPVSALFRRDIVRASESRAGRFCRERPLFLGLALVATFASWGVLLFEYWLLAFFFGEPLSARQLVMGLAAARVSYLLMFPAGLGILEAGQVAAVRAMGIPEALGLSLSLVIRLRDTVTAAAGMGLGMRWLMGKRKTV